jgi:Ca2+:H+ antiporter
MSESHSTPKSTGGGFMRHLQEASLFEKILYGMLVFFPLALVLELSQADPSLIFIFSALAIIPLADFIGKATEELAHYTGPRLGGLLNATLGNAAELIITIFALRQGLVELVRASITGSILGNLLLVLGLSLLAGGLKNGTQKFNRSAAAMNATLLILAVVTLLIPSLFDVAIADNQSAEMGLSEGTAVIMIGLYALSVIYSFSLGKDDTRIDGTVEAHHQPKMSIRQAILLLIVSTVGIVFMSEFLVGAVESVTVSLGLSEVFIGIIIIPLVGNVAEHLVAVTVAYKNKMELSLAVSLGSSLQVALFVAPVLVFLSLFLSPTPLLLVFNEFELIALVVASAIAAFIAQDGESNWLEGAMLLAVYLIIALAFFVLPADLLSTAHTLIP